MEKAIICKFECPSCGMIISTQDVLKKTTNGSKYTFEGPKKCSCGRQSSFTLLTFEPATATIKRDSEMEKKE